MLTKEQLEKLNTKRLLAYLKSARKQLFTYIGEYDWGIEPTNHTNIEKELRDQYESIKEILSKRENIES